jgi:hypothetical protein
MKPIIDTPSFNRRALLSTLAALPVLPGLLPTLGASADPSPLTSWNDGPAKEAILEFVRTTTDRAGAKFVPSEERIATFDQDGTLWASDVHVHDLRARTGGRACKGQAGT